MDGNKKLEETAVSILTRAVVLDKESRYTESLICYQEGLQMLMDVMKDVPKGKKRDTIKQRIEEYIGRAEQIKKIVEEKKEEGTYHEEITIEDNSTGHSYASVMGRFFDEDVTSIRIEDPYIRIFNQFCNLVHFCELAVKKCKNLKKIDVLTGLDTENSGAQKDWLTTLQNDLQSNFNIGMNYNFSSTLHDRQIVLSSGWIIKIGRGLDYFKPPHVKHGIGTFDTDFRPCKATKIDIYHSKNVIGK